MSETELTDALPSDLHYVDTQPGITRKKLRGKFAISRPSGQRYRPGRNKNTSTLAVPPAYVDVDLRRPARSSASYRRDAQGHQVSLSRSFGAKCAMPTSIFASARVRSNAAKTRKQLEALLAAPGFSHDES